VEQETRMQSSGTSIP